MKKILLLWALLISLCTQAQTDSSEIEMDSVDIIFIELPDSAAIGAPDGKLVSKEIGPSGGKVISDDGRVELIFPEGALTAITIISIQPTTNVLPNGSDKAYQFEPSGLRFMKPVQLIFHYTPEEEETCPPDMKFMALQSSNGKWEYLEYTDWDSTGKSLKGSISHFSAFLDGNMMELSPVDTTLKVEKSVRLVLIVVSAPGEDDLAAVTTLENTGRQIKWSVTGGPRFGTIRKEPRGYGAIYSAPKYLSDGDAKVVLKIDMVSIEQVVERSGRRPRTSIRRRRSNLATFICDIKLYDEYEITIIKKGKSILDCGAELEDRSSFKAKIYSAKVEINDLNNAPPTLSKQAKCKGCPLKYDPGNCLGPVHINNDKPWHGRMIDQQAITPPEITIEFAAVRVKVMNSKGKCSGELHEFPEGMDDVVIGNKIKFKADRKSQDHDRSGDGPSHSYRLLIDPL